MVSIVTGNGAGLVNSSKDVLGGAGEIGQAAWGRAGERVTVNAATGNLVVQDRDEYLVGIGADVDLLRTYNSQGGWEGDGTADGWRIGYYRHVSGLSGSVNSAGSTIKRTDADGHEALYTFDAGSGKYLTSEGAGQFDSLRFSGGAWTWTDGDTGTTESYALDTSGAYRLTLVTDPENHVVKVVYDGSNRITSLSTSKDGGTTLDEIVTLNYSGTQLASITTSYKDEAGAPKTRSVTSYSYDNGRLSQVTTDLTPDDATDNATKPETLYTVKYGYDIAGRLQTLTQRDGSQQVVEYWGDGSVKSITEQTVLDYWPDGRVKSVRNDRQTGFVYDAFNHTTTVTDALGQATQLKYDGANQLLEISGAVLGGASFKQSYTYGAGADNGNLLTSTNAKGEVTTYEYSGNGRLARRTDAAGNVLERTYTSDGLLATETVYVLPDPDGVAGSGKAATPRTTQYIYDTTQIAKRHLAYVLGPQGEVTRYTYNPEGLVQRSVQYTGALFTAASPTFTSLEAWVNGPQNLTLDRQVTEYAYDFRGQVKEERRFATETLSGGSTVVEGGLTKTTTTYDAFGRLLSSKDTNGNGTAYLYDGLNRLTRSVDAKNAITLYTYDDANRKTSVKLDNGQTTVQIFDAAGRLVSSDVLGASSQVALGATKYFYDAVGQLRRVQDATGVSAYSLYDVSGRKSADIATNGQLTEYLYDSAGRLIQTVAYANLVSAATLDTLSDAQGQPTAKTVTNVRPAVDASNDRITTFYYDGAGRLIGTLDADGFLSKNQYDGTSALISQTQFATALSGTGLTNARLVASAGTTQAAVPALPTPTADAARDRATRNLYDASGRLGARVDGDGGLTVWKYDAAGNMVSQLRRSALLSDNDRLNGTYVTLTALAPLADDEFTQWVYDAEGRQIAMLSAEGYLTEYKYDTAGRPSDTVRYLTQAKKPLAGTSLNLIKRADLDTLRASAGASLTTTRTYNSRGLLETETAFDGTVTFYDYDNLQRLKTQTLAYQTSEARGQSIDYDDWGRVLSTKTVGDATGVTTGYDAAGRRISVKDARGNTTFFYYDAQGRQVYAILRDPLLGGEVTETIYSNFNEVQVTVTHAKRLSTTDSAALTGGKTDGALDTKVAALADSSDNRTRVNYNRRGLIQQAIDALGYTTDTTYNAFGQVDNTITDTGTVASGLRRLTTTYTYDRRGDVVRRELSGTGVSTVATQASFDALGRLQYTIDERSQTTNYLYARDTGVGKQVTVRDPAGDITTTYDALERVVSRKDRNNHTVSYSYDAIARKMTMTTEEGVQVTTETTRHGQTYKVTDAFGTTTYAYDTHGNLLTTDAGGNVTQNTYDLNDNLIRVVQGLKSNGSNAPTDDGSTVATSYSFDAANRVLTQTVDPDGLLKLKTTYEYDGQGRQVKITDARGTVTTQKFTAKGELQEVVVDADGLKLKTSYSYDAQSRVLTVIEGDGTATARKTEYRFDALGNRTDEIIDPAGIALRTRYEYDEAGHVVVKRNALDEVVARYRYDAAGRLLDSIDGTGAVTRNAYDKGELKATLAMPTRLAAGWATDTDSALATKINALIAGAESVNVFVYDRDGRLTYTVNAGGEVSRRIYDKANRVVETVRYATKLSAATAATMDAVAVQVTGLTPLSADQHSYARYDAIGRLTYSVDAMGAVSRFEYDRNGHIVKQSRYAKLIALPLADGVDPSVALDASNDRIDYFTYDSAGRERFHVDAEGYVSQTIYDDANGITYSRRHEKRVAATVIASTPTTGSFTATVLTNLGSAITVSRQLDRAGRLSVETDGNSVQTQFTYDATGRLETEVQASNVAGQSSTTRYRYNAAGQRIAAIRADGTSLASTTRYDYDSLGRVWHQTDARGIALAEGVGAWEQAERVRLGLPADPAALSASDKATLLKAYTTEYGYDANGRVIKTTDAMGGITQTEYDAFGNASVVTDARGFKRYQVYDKAGRLAQSIDAERYLTAYGYDAFGNLTSATRVDAKVQGSLAAGQGVILAASAPNGGTYVLTNTALDHVTGRRYDSDNRLLKENDAEGFEEGTDTLTAFGQRLSATNKLGYTVKYSYDRLGRLLTETLPLLVQDTSGTRRDVVNEYQYDSRGNRIVSIEAKGLAEERRTEMRYDGTDRLTRRIGAAYTAVAADGTPSVMTPVDAWRYDARGNVIEAIAHGQFAADGQTVVGVRRTLTSYDALNQRTLEIGPDRVVTRYDYDIAGNEIAQTHYATPLADSVALTAGAALPEPALDGKNDRILRSTYDALNRKMSVSLDSLQTWDSNSATMVISDLRPQTVVLQRFFYDAMGNVTERIDGRGNSTKDYFDGIGRRVMTLDAGGALTTWAYGRAGNVATTETRYGALLALAATHQASRQAEQTAANDPAYILSSLLAQGSTEPNRVTAFVLDRLDQVTERRVKDVAYDYVNEDGWRVSGTADAVTTYAYNGLGAVKCMKELVTQSSAVSGPPIWEQTDIVYDGMGRETQRLAPRFKDYQGDTVRPKTDQVYDGLGRIVTVIRRGKDDLSDADDQFTRRVYDGNGQLTSTTDAQSAVTNYSYDTEGNLSRRTFVAVHRADGTYRDVVATYQYDACGRQTAQLDVGTQELRRTRYNAFGEVAARGLGNGWEEFAEYNALGKVIKTNSGDGAIKFYVYDAAGNVTREIRGNGDPSAGINLLTMTLKQAAESTKMYSRISVYNSRNLLVKTMDPQIDMLRDTDSISKLYTEQYEAAWTPSTVTTTSRTPLPWTDVTVASGPSPSITFKNKGSTQLQFAGNNFMQGPRWLGYNVSAPVPYKNGPDEFIYSLASFKGQGRTDFYVVTSNDTGSWRTTRRGYFDVNSSGQVTLVLVDSEDYRSFSTPTVKWAVNAALVGTGGYESISYTVYSATGAYRGGGTIGGSASEGPTLDLSPYINGPGSTSDLRIAYTRSVGREKATINLYVDGSGNVYASQDAAVVANKVNIYVQGRDIKNGLLNLGGITYQVAGVYTPATTTSFGYTRLSFDVRTDFPTGGTYDFTMTALDQYGAAVKDEFGAAIVQEGRVVLGAAGSNPVVYNKVSALKISTSEVITKRQEFNAFGEVVEERDDRVQERMLASINAERKRQGLAAITELSAEASDGARTTLKYNALGLLVAKIDPETWITEANGYRYRARPVTAYGYDLLGRHTTTTDANGQLSRTNQLAGSRGEDGVGAFDFDAMGGAAADFDQSANKGGILQRKFDIFGNLRRVIDANQGVIEQDFDKMGRLTTVTRKNVARYDGMGQSSNIDLQDRYEYDELGQRTRFVDALGGTQNLMTDYDSLGRVVKTITAGGTVTQYRYQQFTAQDNAINAMAGAVSAADSAALSTASKSGGYRRETVRADGRSSFDSVEYFGHTTLHLDLTGATVTYNYDSAGRLASQTNTAHIDQLGTQNILYSYYANGYIRSITDKTTKTLSQYTYDNAGNRVSESYASVQFDASGQPISPVYCQNSVVVYDELNRIERVDDPERYTIRYEYDAVGNRRMIDANYVDGASGGRLDRQTYWYAYDALNRFVVSKGQLSTTTGGTDLNRFADARRGTSRTDLSVSIVAGVYGIKLGYDKNSQRVSAEFLLNGANTVETYKYSGDGFLQLTSINGTLKVSRELDALGRTVVQHDISGIQGNAVQGQHTRSYYDRDNRLQSQTYVDDTGAQRNYTLTYSYYDAVSGPAALAGRDADAATMSAAGKGELARTVLHMASAGTNTSQDTTTRYVYEYWDAAQQYTVSKGTGGPSSITTQLKYGVNGQLLYSRDSGAGVNNNFVTSADGLILSRSRQLVSGNSRITNHNFYYVDSHRIGDVGDTPDEIERVSYAEQLALKDAQRNDPNAKGRTYGVNVGGDFRSTADFDQNYEPINDNYPGHAASLYTVNRDGETLASIAQTLWGDAAMWYLIADANGLSRGAVLKPGQLLVIPNKVTNIHNNSTTWRPYSPGEAIGRTEPTGPTHTRFDKGPDDQERSPGFTVPSWYHARYGAFLEGLTNVQLAQDIASLDAAWASYLQQFAIGNTRLGENGGRSSVRLGDTPGVSAPSRAGGSGLGAGVSVGMTGGTFWAGAGQRSTSVNSLLSESYSFSSSLFAQLGSLGLGVKLGGVSVDSLGWGSVAEAAFGNAIGESLASQSNDYSRWGTDSTEIDRLAARYPAPASVGAAIATDYDDGAPVARAIPLGDGRYRMADGSIRRMSVETSEPRSLVDFAADTASRRARTAADGPVLDQFLGSLRIDSTLAAATPSRLTKVDGSPVTLSFNLSTKQAYWNLGEDNVLRAIPKAYKQPSLDEAARADPNNPFALAGHAGDILTDFALTSAFGTASIFTGGAAYGGLMRLRLGARIAIVTSSMIGDATFQTMQIGANSLSDGRYGVQDFSVTELAVAGALPIAIGGRAAVRELAGELRGMGLPDWNVRLASPHNVNSIGPQLLEFERVGSTGSAGAQRTVLSTNGVAEQAQLASSMVPGLSETQARVLLDGAFNPNKPVEVVLGGSRVRSYFGEGTFRLDSDLDIGFNAKMKNNQVDRILDAFDAQGPLQSERGIRIFSGNNPPSGPIISPQEFFQRSGFRGPFPPERAGQSFGPSGFISFHPDGTITIVPPGGGL